MTIYTKTVNYIHLQLDYNGAETLV